MPPTSSRDFLKIAEQRLTTAKTLFELRLTLDAQYIGGYNVECSLKALILHHTPDDELPATLQRITSGSIMHRPEVLLGVLRERGVVLPVTIAKRMRKMTWRTELRYEVGRLDTGETKAFLKTAKAILDWTTEQLS